MKNTGKQYLTLFLCSQLVTLIVTRDALKITRDAFKSK